MTTLYNDPTVANPPAGSGNHNNENLNNGNQNSNNDTNNNYVAFQVR